MAREDRPGGPRTGRDGQAAVGAYSQTTEGVRVDVRPSYLADQSDPGKRQFFWSYHIVITNHRSDVVQLLRRSWRITDATNRVIEVHGEGVVGEQPVLRPGERFDYTSGTPLETPSGFMVGQYHMVRTETGEAFDVAVPAFSLDGPGPAIRVN